MMNDEDLIAPHLMSYIAADDAFNDESEKYAKDVNRVDLPANERRSAAEAFRSNLSSQLPNLYNNLRKNAESILRFGRGSYPALRYTRDIKTGEHKIENSPKISAVINKSMPFLQGLAALQLEGAAGKTKASSCATMQDANIKGDLLSTLRSSNTSSNLDGLFSDIMDAYGKSSGSLSTCSHRPCVSQTKTCEDCSTHQAHVARAVAGLTALDSSDSKEASALRPLHIANLITTLGSWANHLDQRGSLGSTATDPRFMEDKHAAKHQLLSTALRLTATRLSKAANADSVESGGTGGLPHNDSFYRSFDQGDKSMKDIYPQGSFTTSNLDVC